MLCYRMRRFCYSTNQRDFFLIVSSPVAAAAAEAPLAAAAAEATLAAAAAEALLAVAAAKSQQAMAQCGPASRDDETKAISS